MSGLSPRGSYAELAAASNFSFLRGASHPKDLVLTAILRAHAGLGLADRNTVAGVVRAWSALKELRAVGLAPPEKMRDGGSPGEVAFIDDPLNDLAESEEVKRRAADFRLLTGARLVFNDDTPDIIAYPETRAGWGRLTRLLTLGNRRAKKGECEIGLGDLLTDPEGLLLILMPPDRLAGLETVLARVAQAAPGAVWLGAAMHRRGDDRRRLARLKAIAASANTPPAGPQRRSLRQPRRSRSAGPPDLHPRRRDHRDRRPPTGGQRRTLAEARPRNGPTVSRRPRGGQRNDRPPVARDLRSERSEV